MSGGEQFSLTDTHQEVPMWKRIAIVVVVLIAAVLIFAATRPGDFSVQRSIAIKAEPAKIYPLLVDFRQWPAWSPWPSRTLICCRRPSIPPPST